MKSTIKLKILGSVSPYPTKNDNCPGYLISIDDKKILLDCGNGSIKELSLPDDLINLNVFISHLHKDHYSDLNALAYASYVYHNLGILKERIKVYIPKVKPDDLEYIDYLLIKNNKEQYFELIEYDENSIFEIDNYKITFMKNYHPMSTYSTKIENNQFKFVYTSDLGYASKDDIVTFARNASYLLIESSLLIEDGILNEYHLRAFEAADIAKNAGVKNLILTHFWPETKGDKYLKEAKTILNNVIIAKTGNKLNLK